MTAEDGDLVLTVATIGATIPTCSVKICAVEPVERPPVFPLTLDLSPGDPWSFGCFEARRLACEVEDVLASALFGWLP